MREVVSVGVGGAYIFVNMGQYVNGTNQKHENWAQSGKEVGACVVSCVALEFAQLGGQPGHLNCVCLERLPWGWCSICLCWVKFSSLLILGHICVGGGLGELGAHWLLKEFEFELGLIRVFLLRHPWCISSPESRVHFDAISTASSELQGNKFYFFALTW